MLKFYKSGKKSIYQLLLCVLVLLYMNDARAAFSGTYTLNPALAASATNYQNMTSFARDLYGGGRTDGGTANGAGVTGPVVLRMAAGLTLTEQIEFRAVTGASATNTITIKGNLSTLQFTATVATLKWTIWMNGTRYYTIDSLNVLSNSATLAWGVRFSNDASNNIITNSSVILPNIVTGVTSSPTSTGTQAAICFTASTSILDYTSNSTTSSGNNGSNNKIMNCTIGGSSTTLGPTYGIFENLSNTTGNNSYINNKIQHFYLEGLACHTADGIIITGNDFNRLGNTALPSVTLKCINIYNNVRCALNPIVINNNIFHDISTTSTLHAYYHINSATYITGNNGGAKLSSFNNNKIFNFTTTASTFYGIYVSTVKNSGGLEARNNEIYQNTSGSSTIYGIYATGNSITDVRNNEIYKNFSGSSTFYGIYSTGNDKLVVNANRIRTNKGAIFYGMYDATSSTNCTFTNNLIFKNVATTNEYGIYLGGSGAAWVGNNYSNNTIAFDSIGWSTTGTCYGIYISAGSATGLPRVNNILNNNIFMGHKGSSSAVIRYGIYNLWGYNGYLEERNNVHFDTTNISPSTTYYGSDYQGPLVNFSTLAAWSAFGYSNKDLNVNPKFIKSNYSDYRINNPALFKIGSNANVSKDILGINRIPGGPDIGAFENPFNLTVDAVNILNNNLCSGFSDSIRLRIFNNTIYKFKDLQLGVSVNGVPYTTAVMASVPIGYTTLTFPVTLKLSQLGPKVIKFYNINTDASAVDDTITRSFTVLPSPGGSVITLKPGSKGFFNHALGYDVTAFDENIVYNMSSPKKYTDLEYGSKWSVLTWATDAVGTTLPGTPYTFTHTSNTEMTFKPSITYVDKLITLYTQVKDLVNGCDTIYKRTLFIAPKGIINYTVPSAVCFLTDIDFINNSSISSGDLTYTWDFGDGSDPYIGKFAKHNYAAAGKYTVTLSTKSIPFGYVKDTSFEVDVREIPRTNFTKTNACEGMNIVLTNTTQVNTGTATYVWDFGDGSPTSTSTNVNNKVYASPGVYTVTLTASKGGCEYAVSKNVYQFAKPKADFVKVSGSCVNTPIGFDNTSTLSIGNVFSLWDFNDAGSTSTDADPVYTFKTAGNKNVRLVLTSEFGCKDSITKVVSVKEAPTTDFTYTAACDATPTSFSNTTNLNNEVLFNYAWDFGDGTVSSATHPVKSWTNLGPRPVKLKTTLINGCSSEITKIVDVGVQPKVDFNLVDACSGSPVSFENLTNYNPSKIVYAWSFGDGGKSSDNSPSYVYNTLVTQTYVVKLKGSVISGCSDSMSKTVTIAPLPTTCTFDIIGNVNAATKGIFSFVPKGASMSNTTYTWVTGDGTTLTSNQSGTNYTYDAPGVFCVKMVARNLAGCVCEATKCQTLTTDINSAVSMNNALSVYPNPSNGIFNVKFETGVESVMTVKVYNSVGVLVKTVTADSNNTNIDLSEYASGVYVVKVVADNYTATRKITLSR